MDAMIGVTVRILNLVLAGMTGVFAADRIEIAVASSTLADPVAAAEEAAAALVRPTGRAPDGG